MPDIKVVKDATVKDVEQVFAVGSSNTLYSVNYVVRYTFTIFKGNTLPLFQTLWNAISQTSRITDAATATSFTTSYNTTFDTNTAKEYSHII